MKKLTYLLFFAIIFGQEASKDNIQNISIVSTANVYSEFYDCGCPKNPLGGLARKTFFLKNMMHYQFFLNLNKLELYKYLR